MSDIEVFAAAETVESTDDLAPTRNHTPGETGGYVPQGLAGYVYNGACYCPECAFEVEIPTPDGDGETDIAHFPAFETNETGCGVGVLNCSSETDYPGDVCDVCHRTLDTNVLVYRDGPGSELYERLTDR